jgi:Polyketide cyclase / dehydrase and lipid transport
MRPITFACEATLGFSPDEIARRILDLANWPDFKGYAMLPGIRSAEYEVKTPAVVGSRIRVTNSDGSSHVEEIVEWQPDQRVRLHMHDFSAPLSRLATSFEETWEFTRADNATRVTRSFELCPKSAFARPLLWVISTLLRKAVARHLREMASNRPGTSVSSVRHEPG